MDGVGGGVQLEVQLQLQRTVGSYHAGKHVARIAFVKDIGRGFGQLVILGDGHGGTRGALADFRMMRIIQIGTVQLLIVGLYPVGSIRCGFPYGIQIVAAACIHPQAAAGGKGDAAGGGGAPPLEVIALPGGEPGSIIGKDLYPAVDRQSLYGIGGVRAEVAVIGQGDGVFLHAPYGVQGHILSAQDQLAAGIVIRCGSFCAQGPAKELGLICGSGKACAGEYSGSGPFRIPPIVYGHIARTAVGVIGNGVGVETAYSGIDMVITGDQHAGVEGGTVLHDPAQEGIAFCRRISGDIAVLHGGAVGDARNGLYHGDLIFLIEGNGVHRGHPLGIEGDVLGGHGLAGKGKLLPFALLVIVPAGEDIPFLPGGGGGGILRIGNGLLELPAFGFIYAAAVDELDLIAVAGVVKPGVVISASVVRTFFIGKACDGILIFVSNSISCTGAGILMMELVAHSVISLSTGFPGQDFHIVVSRFGTAVGLGAVEAGAPQRHGLDIDLIGTGQSPAIAIATCSAPSAAAVVGGPLIADIGAVLSSNAQTGVFYPSVALPVVELHLIHIAGVIYLYNGGTVPGDGGLGDGLGGKAGVAFGSGCGLAAGGAGSGFDVLGGVAVVIGVLQEVDHRVAGSACLPTGHQRGVFGNGGKVGSGAGFRKPAVEHIAGASGSGGGCGGLALGIESRGHIRAALGIEGDPEALAHLGGQSHIRPVQRYAVYGGAVQQPAGDGFIPCYREGYTGCGDSLSVPAGSGSHYGSAGILEEYIEYIRKGGGKGNGLRGGDPGYHAKAGKPAFACVPAIKPVAFLCGGGRLQQRIAVFHDLAGDLLLLCHKDIGAVERIVRNDGLRLHRGLFFDGFLLRWSGSGGYLLLILLGSRHIHTSFFHYALGLDAFRYDVHRQCRKEHHERKDPCRYLGQGVSHGLFLLFLFPCCILFCGALHP